MHECDKIREWMLDYFDGRLAPDRLKVLNRHLDACTQCRDLFEAMEALMKAEQALDKKTPADLHEQIMGAVRWNARLDRLRTRSRRRAWIAAACACLIIIGAGAVSFLGSGMAKSSDAAQAMDTSDSNCAATNPQYEEADGSTGGESDAITQENTEDQSESNLQEDEKSWEEDTESIFSTVLAGLETQREYSQIVVCDTEDPAALENVVGEKTVEINGYRTMTLEPEILQVLLANGMLSNPEYDALNTGSDPEAVDILLVLRP